MINGQKIVAFTPAGRKRYMDLLSAHVKREVDAGNIDQWILFNNAYDKQDATYGAQLAEQFPWVKVLTPRRFGKAEHIADFFGDLIELGGVEDTLYFRIDDDIIYIDPQCVPRLVDFRLANSKPFLCFPTIINNVRTSFHMQEQGVVNAEKWAGSKILNEMCDITAWKSSAYVFQLHQKALAALESGSLDEFTLKTQTYDDPAEVPDGDIWEAGHISINSFMCFGTDLAACAVPPDEEGYLSLWRPKDLDRPNARVGDAFVIHFAYHTQTAFMDKSGMILDYAKFAPELGYRTKREPPPMDEHLAHDPHHITVQKHRSLRPRPMKPFVPRFRRAHVPNLLPPRRGQFIKPPAPAQSADTGPKA